MTHPTDFDRSETASARMPVAGSVQVLVSMLALGLQTSPLHAQAPDAASSTVTVRGDRESPYAEKRTTTATKTETPLLDTPQSISVITRQSMQDRGVQSLAEAAAYVPGVGFAQGEGNRETPIFRGVATTGDFFIDGIRDDVQYYRDLYNIESVEVFRGPNAMIFGRGATGGLINRVSKQPEWVPSYGGSLTFGSHSNKRVTADVNQPLSSELALRVNGMYEKSDSYRDGVWIERSGINPSLAWRPGANTLIVASYEHFKDDRIADRGIPSYQGRPVDTDPSTFFGHADKSPTGSSLDAFSLLVDHRFGNGISLRNRTRWSDQDKFYQNVFPGAVTGGNQVSIAAYNNATDRKSIFNQTDLTYAAQFGSVKHRLLAGMELGKQDTDNFRMTGYFNGGNATSVLVPLSSPQTNAPIDFRQSANDADNSGTAKVAALYLQDQIELSPAFQVIAGVRFDRFEVDFRNNRTGERVSADDDLVSPRIGVIYKPMSNVSLYANYSLAHQPRAGEQLASLTLTNAALKPEKFKNYEIGAKWDIRPNLSATAAFYRLDRTNVSVLDPNDQTRSILADGQRTEGFELGLTGSIAPGWSVAGGYSYTDARFTGDISSTVLDGSRVASVPKHTFALWNRYDFSPTWGAGVGIIHRTKMFAANEQRGPAAPAFANVELPAYTRIDAAVFATLSKNLRLQVNVENLFDKAYIATAHSNTNLTPGAPRSFRISLNANY